MRFLAILLLSSLAVLIGGCGGAGSPIPPQSAQIAPDGGGLGNSPGIRGKYSSSQYRLIDLGANFSPSRINSNNHVAGALAQGATSLAAMYAGGKVTAFPGAPGQVFSKAWDINDNDMVVGEVDSTGQCQRAALFHPSAVPTLYYMCEYGAQSVATGINNAGEIVGHATPGICDQAAIFAPGPTTLLSSDGVGLPAAVNTAGVIAATQFDSFVGGCEGGALIPVEYNPAASIPLPPDANQPYSDALDQGGWATDINDHGSVVGTYYTCVFSASGSCGQVGFIYSAGKTTPVYDPNAQKTSACVLLNGINNAAQVVGTMGQGNGSSCTATVAILVHDSVPVDLNTLITGHKHWHLTSAADVNDSGVIVGSGMKSGVQHGFMLMPKFCPLPVRR